MLPPSLRVPLRLRVWGWVALARATARHRVEECHHDGQANACGLCSLAMMSGAFFPLPSWE